MHQEKNLKRNSYAKFLCWAFITFTLIVLLYTYFRAEVTFNGTRNNIYYKYYFLSLFSLFFWSIVLKVKDEIRLNIVLIISSITFSIYLVEIIISLVLSSYSSSEQDTRTVYEVYSDLLDKGMDVVPSVRPTIFVLSDGLPHKNNTHLFPLAGVSNKTTVYCNESGERIIYESDQYGFRNLDSAWNLKRDIWAIVGNSFAHGACVKDEEKIATQIQNLKKNNSVLSFGIGGNGPLIELATLQEYLTSLEPDVVMWFYFEGNDLVNNLKYELNSPLLRSYLNPNFTQNLQQRQPEIDFWLNKHIGDSINLKNEKILSRLENFIQNSRTIRLLNIRRFIGIDKQEEDFIVSPLYKQILSEAKERVEKWEGKLFFVYIPEYSRYLLKDQDDLDFRARGEVLNIVKSLNIPIIDIHEKVFKKYTDPLSFFPKRTEPHYTPEGYKLMGEALVEGIENVN
tara:strand:- start:11027 stop:12388 length:1362 start_codon:yes stop_codon:yes gene_type:complete